jgi:oxygen-independent coproporphyrinogen III oxidase
MDFAVPSLSKWEGSLLQGPPIFNSTELNGIPMPTRFPAYLTETTTCLSAPAAPGGAFGIYIHIPFCTRVCPYCDFHTFSGQESRIPDYVTAVQREAPTWAADFAGRQAASIFFGGGTPSLLTPEQVAALLRTCHDHFNVDPDAEITLEANPNNLDERYCAGLLVAGVNRLSIGAQTLDRRGLRVLGRLHEATQTIDAVRSARHAGFEQLSLDFIYGWPGQVIDQWQTELKTVLDGDVGGSLPDHLSLYSLIVEPGTPMADAVQRGILNPADDDTAADFYEAAIDGLSAAGWVHYEISNWCSSPAQQSRHNALYWRNGEYVGLGVAAHGHVKSRRTMNQPSLRRYIELVGSGRSQVSNVEQIDDRTAMGETMMLGLRLLRDGVSETAFVDRHGVSMSSIFGSQLSKLISAGLITYDDHRVRLTPRGTLVANSVCAEFL